jgi:diamine N-acetyltransferase
MLEWLSDAEYTNFLRVANPDTTKGNILSFIKNARVSFTDRHYAVIDDRFPNDEYLGTVSLKNIDTLNGNAEYAISLRKCAIGAGIGLGATEQILSVAFAELKLEKVYLNVLEDNIRAVKMYEKTGFRLEGRFLRHLFKNGEYRNLLWFAMTRDDWETRR